MIIRDITIGDYGLIDTLNQLQDFKLKNISNAIIDKIVMQDDNPIAYGFCKKQAEVIILTNPDASLISRAKAMRELMQYAEYGASKFGCEQLHAFVNNEKLARCLIKHFGFVKTQDIVLVKNL